MALYSKLTKDSHFAIAPTARGEGDSSADENSHRITHESTSSRRVNQVSLKSNKIYAKFSAILRSRPFAAFCSGNSRWISFAILLLNVLATFFQLMMQMISFNLIGWNNMNCCLGDMRVLRVRAIFRRCWLVLRSAVVGRTARSWIPTAGSRNARSSWIRCSIMRTRCRSDIRLTLLNFQYVVPVQRYLRSSNHSLDILFRCGPR